MVLTRSQAKKVFQKDFLIKKVVCTICLEEIRDEDLCFLNNCTHSFCFKCIDKWSSENKNCPLCRSTYKYYYFKEPKVVMVLVPGSVVKRLDFNF